MPNVNVDEDEQEHAHGRMNEECVERSLVGRWVEEEEDVDGQHANGGEQQEDFRDEKVVEREEEGPERHADVGEDEADANGVDHDVLAFTVVRHCSCSMAE